MGKLPVFFKILYPEIDSAVDLIGKAFVDQSLDHLDHAVDFLGSQRMGGSRFYIHIRHILFAFFDIAGGNFFSADPFFNSLGNDLIIYICEVRYIVNLITFVLHISAHSIKNDHRSGISDMDKVIDRRPAYIHFHLSLFQRNKLFLSFCQGIVDLHEFSPFLLALSNSALCSCSAFSLALRHVSSFSLISWSS